MSARYVVVTVSGIGLGAGGFVVRDTLQGTDSLPMIWRSDADRVADRQNLADAYEREHAK